MAFETAVNTFEGGLNKDVVKKALKANSYSDARNVSISGDGENFSLSGIDGSSQNVLLSLNEIHYTDPEILAIVNCTIQDENAIPYKQIPGVAYIIKQERGDPSLGGKIKIVLHAVHETAMVQVIYDQVYDLDIMETHPDKLSAFSFGEGGIDYIYFTDDERFLRKVPCRMKTPKSIPVSNHDNSGGFLQVSFFGDDFNEEYRAGRHINLTFSDTYTSGQYIIISYSQIGLSTHLTLDWPYIGSPSGATTVNYPGLSFSDKNTRVIPASLPGLYPTTFTAPSGGNLLSGTYIVYLRLLNDLSNKTSDWTIGRGPLAVFNTEALGVIDSTVGRVTDKKVLVTFVLEAEMLSEYTHVQYALVERVQGITTYQTASLGSPVTLDGFSSGDTVSIDIFSNQPGSTVSLSSIIIDDASIQSAESITTKNNRLIAGGIQYKDLLFDHPSGLPKVDGGSFSIYEYKGDSGSTERGYFRDEVYRFGLAYFNEDGVYGNVIPIDFSGFGANSATSGTDLKFPARKDGGKWAIKDSVLETPTVLGLNIGEIRNHPTWAKGVEIVRVKRKKNVQFQTPMVPTMYIGPVQAANNYPVLDSDDVTYEAIPALPQGSFVPKNYFRPWNEAITDEGAGIANGSGYGGASLDQKSHYAFLVFDPGHIYNTGDKYSFSSGDKIEIVDLAILKSDVEFYSNKPSIVDGENEHGNYIDTEAHYTGRATSKDDYYIYGTGTSDITFNFTNPGADANESSEILDYQTIENLGNGAVLSTTAGIPFLNSNDISHGTNKICVYADLQADGIKEGVTPQNLKMSAIIVKDKMPDASHYSSTTSGVDFRANHAYGSSSRRIADTYLTHAAFNKSKNDFLTADDTYTNAISIANITRGLSDERYGDINEFHEYIRTGSVYNFSESEITSIEQGAYRPISIPNILGGDCYLSLHSFKVSDGVYSNASTENANSSTLSNVSDDITRWEKGFHQGTKAAPSGALMARPVPLKAVSQVIAVWLESEVNASILDRSIYNPSNNFTLYHHPYGEGELKVPFLYDYSVDFSLHGDGKVFFPNDYTVKGNPKFPARLLYSNQKIYQSFEEGFDRYPVLNFFDLEERYGDISNLHTFKDRVYAFQESSISYIPIDKGVVETADGVSMSLQTGQIIGTPLFVSTYLGSTISTNVISNNDIIFAIDRKRGAIIAFDGSTVSDLSSKGMETFFRGADYTDLTYDYSRKELIVYDRHSAAIDPGSDDSLKFRPVIFSDKTKAWVSELDGIAGDFIGFSWQSPKATSAGQPRTKNGLMAMAKVPGSDDMNIHDMYENESTSTIFGSNVTPYVKYTVNKDPLNVKTFDVIGLYSSKVLSTVKVATFQPEIDQDTTMTAPSESREGVYRFKTLRDSGNRRIRNVFADITVTWNPEFTAKLSHAVTKYRLSKRITNKEE